MIVWYPWSRMRVSYWLRALLHCSLHVPEAVLGIDYLQTGQCLRVQLQSWPRGSCSLGAQARCSLAMALTIASRSGLCHLVCASPAARSDSSEEALAAGHVA